MAQKIGRFVARGVGSPEVGESRKKNTPFIGAEFEVIDNPRNPPEFIGRKFEISAYLTDGTAERSIGAFTLAGCKDAASFNFAGFGSTLVEIEVESDEFGPKVNFVNPISAGGVDDRNRITGKAKADLAARLKLMLGGAKGIAVPVASAALGSAGKDPFAVKGTPLAPVAASFCAPDNDGGSYLESVASDATGTDGVSIRDVPF